MTVPTDRSKPPEIVFGRQNGATVDVRDIVLIHDEVLWPYMFDQILLFEDAHRLMKPLSVSPWVRVWPSWGTMRRSA